MGDVWEMGRGDMFIIHKGVLLFLNFGSFTYLSSYFSQSCDSPARPPCPPSFGLPALRCREQAGGSRRADWSGAGGYERLMSLRLKRPHPPYGSYDWPLSRVGEGGERSGGEKSLVALSPALPHLCIGAGQVPGGAMDN